MSPARLLRAGAGVLIVAGCLIFLADSFLEAGGELIDVAAHPAVWAGAAAAGVGYGVLLTLLALSWGVALRRNLQAGFAWSHAIRIYAISSLAKYLPGNVFHLAGRQIMAGRLGWAQSTVAGASLTELSLQVLVVAGLVAASLMFAREEGAAVIGALLEASPVSWGWIAAAAGLALMLALSVPAIRRWPIWRLRLSGRDVASMVVLQVGFFAGNIVLVAFGHGLIADTGAFPVAVAGAAYLASWLLGFLTPGAPGGLGVREAAFTLVMGPASGTGTALSLVLFMRVATTLGEALFAAAGYVLGRAQATEAETEGN